MTTTNPWRFEIKPLRFVWVRPQFGLEHLPLELLVLGPWLGRLLQLLVWLLPLKGGGFDFYRTEGVGFYCRQVQVALNVLWFGLCLTLNRRLPCTHPEELVEQIGLHDWGELRCRRCAKVLDSWGALSSASAGAVPDRGCAL